MKQRDLEDILEAHALWIASGTQAGACADLTNQVLVDVDLTGRDLRWARLCGSHWTRAVLRGVCLSGADLEGATLHRADLRDAVLVRANLRGADLRDADLRGAKLVARVGYNELDLPRDIHAADLTGALLEGARIAQASLVGTGALGSYEHRCEGSDPYALPTRAEPPKLPTVDAPMPARVREHAQPAMPQRGHDRETLLAIARSLAMALPELERALPSLANASWSTGLAEGLDAYEACTIAGHDASLSVHVHIARCDTSSGPVETGRSTTFTLARHGTRATLGWSGTGRLRAHVGDPALLTRLCAAGLLDDHDA